MKKEDEILKEIEEYIDISRQSRFDKLREAINNYKKSRSNTSYKMVIMDLANNLHTYDLTYEQSRLYIDKSLKEKDLKRLGWNEKRGVEYNELLLKTIKNELL